ncbi:transcription repressor OFP12-like [Phalaenopsis equestris]|uniref:transcription repressor OFP12-like n=1 Tax=Phalaenopsis equestris TaxID=78828 RepID=UPI0009E48A91|nr:transcription repressor OFP12-like [Phalaenopsis equestris]
MLGCFSRQRRPYPIPPPLPNTSTSFSNNLNSLYNPIPNPSEPPQSPSQTLTLTLAHPDPISSAISSRRLIPAFPGRSNSIVESAAVSIGIRGSAVAIPTYSPEPYLDFRRSMEEMVAALGVGTHIDLAVLYELLLCYLSVNRKQAHKYILTAFTDLLLALLTAAGDR